MASNSTSVVPTAGRGHTTLCRAAPSLRDGGEKGNTAPTHKDEHSSSHRHPQAQLCQHSHSKHHTQSQGERQRNLQGPPAEPGCCSLLPVHGTAGCSFSTGCQRVTTVTGPASPVKKQDTAVPALFTNCSVMSNSNHKPYGLETHNQSI